MSENKDLIIPVITQALKDDIQILWFDLMCRQGSQLSRRIARRCLIAEKRSVDILMDTWIGRSK